MPCFGPSVCESCGTSGTLTLEAGYNEKYVITLTGKTDFFRKRQFRINI